MPSPAPFVKVTNWPPPTPFFGYATYELESVQEDANGNVVAYIFKTGFANQLLGWPSPVMTFGTPATDADYPGINFWTSQGQPLEYRFWNPGDEPNLSIP